MKDTKTPKVNYERTAIIVLVIVIIIMMFSMTGFDPKKDNRSGEYERTINEVEIIKIIDDYPNVRSEPIADDDSADGYTNSFGSTKETNFTMEVSKVYTTDKNLDQNGAYYGLLVEDILNTPEGKNWFPSKIKNDPDGIVWINSEYLKILD